MNPFGFLVILMVLFAVVFLITNILYPIINKDVEFFWWFKTDWFERSENLRKEQKERKKKSRKK